MEKNIIKENRKIGLKENTIESILVAYNLCNNSFEKYDIQIILVWIQKRYTSKQNRRITHNVYIYQIFKVMIKNQQKS